MNLDSISTLDELKGLRYKQIFGSLHIIVGGNGRCMCGVYDGKAIGCSEIIRMATENTSLKPDKTVRVPKYVYITEGYDPDKLAKIT